jgi:outer membrane protein assembly factor BamB
MRRSIVIISLVLVCMAAALGGCTNTSSDTLQTPEAGCATAGQANVAWLLPAPAEALAAAHQKSSSAAVLTRLGSEFEPGLTQLAFAEGTSARFSPAWHDNTSSFSTTAYAIYSYNLKGYTGVNSLRLYWGEAPADFSNLWIGLSRWSDDHWDWYHGPANGQLFPPGTSFDPYIKSDAGDMLVAVVELGSASVLLNFLRIGNPVPDDWSTFGHDVQRTHRSPFAGPVAPSVKWSYETAEKIMSTPSLAPNGVIYLGSNDGYLHAVNPDGSPRWKCETGATHSSAPAIAPDGTIYICGGNNLYAIDASGAVKWFYAAGDLATSSPAIATDGTVYFGSNDSNLYAVNPDGSLKWSYAAQDDVSTPALYDDGSICFGSWDHNCYCLSQDGSFKWSYGVATMFPSAPAIATDGSTYVTEWGSAVHAVDQSGAFKWSYSIVMMLTPSPALAADGTVYAGSSDYGVYQPFFAISPAGVKLWEYDTVGAVSGAASIDTNGTVYIATRNGKVIALSPDGALKWDYTVTTAALPSAPVIGADGTLYLGSEDYSLYALGPGPD